MPDADLADLRNTLDRCDVLEGRIRGWVRSESGTIELAAIDADDVRALVARLDAAEDRRDLAEDLLREVANSGVEFDDHRLNWIAAQIGRDTFTKCRSYLR
jgi:hypothetical protein